MTATRDLTGAVAGGPRGRTSLRLGVAGLAVGALAGSGLVTTPAGATVTDAGAEVSVWFTDMTAGCTRTGASTASTDVAWSDNGAPVTRSYTAAGRHTNDADPEDVVDVRASGTVTVASTPLSGGPGRVTVRATADASAVPRQPSTSCQESAAAHATAFGKVTLSRPMWVTLTVSGTGNGAGWVSFDAVDGEGGVQTGNRGSGTTTFLAVPGPLRFAASSSASADSTGQSPRSARYTGTYTIELQSVGAGSTVRGKGHAFAVFGARSCATGRVPVDITKKAKRRASQVRITVNGKRVVKLKGKRLTKRSLLLPAVPSSGAAVVATIKLRNGRTVTTSRSYLACR